MASSDDWSEQSGGNVDQADRWHKPVDSGMTVQFHEWPYTRARPSWTALSPEPGANGGWWVFRRCGRSDAGRRWAVLPRSSPNSKKMVVSDPFFFFYSGVVAYSGQAHKMHEITTFLLVILPKLFTVCVLTWMFHEVVWQHRQGMVRFLINALLQIYQRILQWKKIVNRLRFDRSMAMRLGSRFFGPPCRLYYSGLTTAHHQKTMT